VEPQCVIYRDSDIFLLVARDLGRFVTGPYNIAGAGSEMPYRELVDPPATLPHTQTLKGMVWRGVRCGAVRCATVRFGALRFGAVR
jgi:hypothetical protein